MSSAELVAQAKERALRAVSKLGSWTADRPFADEELAEAIDELRTAVRHLEDVRPWKS